MEPSLMYSPIKPLMLQSLWCITLYVFVNDGIDLFGLRKSLLEKCWFYMGNGHHCPNSFPPPLCGGQISFFIPLDLLEGHSNDWVKALNLSLGEKALRHQLLHSDLLQVVSTFLLWKFWVWHSRIRIYNSRLCLAKNLLQLAFSETCCSSATKCKPRPLTPKAVKVKPWKLSMPICLSSK